MAAVLSQARQIASDIIATDHVEHCLNPMTCGDFQHRLDKIGSGIVDRMGRSNLQRSRAFFVTAAGDDDLHAKQAAQRNGRRANAAGAAMNQHNIALYDIGPLEQIATDREKRFGRSEEHTSELQSLILIPYAAFCLKKKK